MAIKSSANSNFESLFGAKSGERLANGLKLIPRERIQRGDQPRRSFPKEELDELSRSITELRHRGEGIEGTGLLQPLLVFADGDSYQLIAGERRWRASEAAGIAKLPVIVVPAPAQGLLLSQLVENLQRRDLPPLEEAQALEQMMQEQKLSIRNAAALIGKGKGYVEERLRLLRMAPDVQDLVSGRPDTLTHAREIDNVDNPNLRATLIQAVQQQGISVAEVRQRIAAAQQPDQASTSRATLEQNRPTDIIGNRTEVSGRPDTSSSRKKGEAIPTVNSPDQSRPESQSASNIGQALQPGLALLSEAVRDISSRSLSSEELKMTQQRVKQLKAIVEQLEEVLTNAHKDKLISS